MKKLSPKVPKPGRTCTGGATPPIEYPIQYTLKRMHFLDFKEVKKEVTDAKNFRSIHRVFHNRFQAHYHRDLNFLGEPMIPPLLSPIAIAKIFFRSATLPAAMVIIFFFALPH